jgi:hypothetical protein
VAQLSQLQQGWGGGRSTGGGEGGGQQKFEGCVEPAVFADDGVCTKSANLTAAGVLVRRCLAVCRPSGRHQLGQGGKDAGSRCGHPGLLLLLALCCGC